MAVPLMCCAADMLSVPSRKQIVLIGHKPSEEFEEMIAAAHALYEPNRTVSSPPLFLSFIWSKSSTQGLDYHVIRKSLTLT